MKTARKLYQNHGLVLRAQSPIARMQGRAKFLAGCPCQDPQPLGALGLSLISKIIKSATPGPNEFKLKSTPKEIKKVIAVAGPALSVIPGWGTLAAAGATIITAADQRQKAQRLAGTSSSAQLMQEYSSMAGTVPGRVFGIENMSKVIDAIGVSGGWPNVKKWSGGVVPQVLTTGCKGCTPPTLKDWVTQKLSQGQDNPVSLAGEWTNWVNQSWGSKWFAASAGDVQRQAIIDTIDAFIAQANPNAPLYYAQPAGTPQTQGVTPVLPPNSTVTPLPAPVPVPTPGSVPTPSTGTGAPLGTPTVSAPTSATDPNLQAYIQALLNQGRSSQEAFSSALNALGSQGVPITPQVQAAVADTVQAASSTSPAWLMPAVIVAGAGAVFYALSRRRKRA